MDKLLLFQNSVASNATLIHVKSMMKMHEQAMSVDVSITATSAPAKSVVGHTDPPLANKPIKSVANYSKRDRNRKFSYFFGLSRFGLLWALRADIHVSWSDQGISIHPGLHFQKLVKFTSPGLNIVWKALHDQLEIKSACESLVELFRRGDVSPHDVFPDGATWLERMINPYLTSPLTVFAILKVLLECGAPMNTKTSLLVLAARLNHTHGWHIRLLKELITIGYDCAIDASTDQRSWEVVGPLSPQPCNLHYKGEGDDLWSQIEPFLLNFFTECSKNAYGVCGQTPLMDAILCGSVDEIIELLNRFGSLEGRNYLGQTPVHVAVLRPNVLSSIVHVCQDLDKPDYHGRTPLEYAAAYGRTESVIILLNAGAAALNGQHISFLQYAGDWCQWHLLSETLAFLRRKRYFSDAFLQSELCRLVLSRWSKNFGELLSLGIETRTLFEDGSTLLHHATIEADAIALFATGFQYIDLANHAGHTALMTSVIYDAIEVSNVILEQGCNVDHQDELGLSALSLACHRLGLSTSLSSQSPVFSLIAKLLHRGANPFSFDKCRCACSFNGCSPSTLLLNQKSSIFIDYYYDIEGSVGYIWVLEWLLMLAEFQGQSIARTALLDLIRFREFQKAKITHVCLSHRRYHLWRYHSYSIPINTEDVDEIMEEEREHIYELDKTMGKWDEELVDRSVEEVWLSIIADFAELPRDQGLCECWNFNKSGDPLVSYFSLPSDPAATYQMNSNNPPLRVDETNDKYYKIYPHRFLDSTASQIYSSWVEYFYRGRALYDYPVQITQEWYEKRKYWAARQAEVLDGISRFSEVE